MKQAILPDNSRVSLDDQFIIGDQRYPAGWLKTATAPEIAAAGIAIEELPDPEPPVEEPQPILAVTMRQARLALLGANLLDQVNAAVEAAGPAAKIEWEYATEVNRSWPLLTQLVGALELTEEQVDQLFVAASTL